MSPVYIASLDVDKVFDRITVMNRSVSWLSVMLHSVSLVFCYVGV